MEHTALSHKVMKLAGGVNTVENIKKKVIGPRGFKNGHRFIDKKRGGSLALKRLGHEVSLAPIYYPQKWFNTRRRELPA